MYNSLALNSFLAFRFVYDDMEWKEGLLPYRPQINNLEKYLIDSSEDIINSLSQIISEIDENKTALLLSGGIDSAIIASFLGDGMPVYSIKFEAENAIDETIMASIYAKEFKLNHKIINISYNNYMSVIDTLIKNKKSPLHSIEPALYIASQKIKDDGYTNILTGCNADGKFGGLDGLLSKNWKLDEFIKRYSFVNSKNVLKKSDDMSYVYKKYTIDNNIDIQSFLNEIFGYDTYMSFSNGINSAGCKLIAPFAFLKLKNKLDIQRIRNGESKYLLREVFKKRYKNLSQIPKKIPFARPMDEWLYNWSGPKREEFIKGIDMSNFSGNQKWLIFCLEYFLNYFDN